MTEERPSRPAEAYRPPPRELLWLAGAIALVEVVLALADRGVLGDPSLRGRLYMAGAFWSGLLRGAEPAFGLQPATMFVSHAFLHGGMLHMIMNTVVLLGLGRLVADRYGPGAVLPVFLAGAVAGGAAFGLLSASPLPMVGASGAVFGFIGVWIVQDWRRLRAARRTVRPVLSRVAGFALINVIFFVALGGMLAWEAHLGGFLAGLAAGALLEGRRDRRVRAAEAAARAAARARRDGEHG